MQLQTIALTAILATAIALPLPDLTGHFSFKRQVIPDPLKGAVVGAIAGNTGAANGGVNGLFGTIAGALASIGANLPIGAPI